MRTEASLVQQRCAIVVKLADFSVSGDGGQAEPQADHVSLSMARPLHLQRPRLNSLASGLAGEMPQSEM